MATKNIQPGRDLDPIIPIDQIEHRILMVRGQRVILAADLARMYGATVKQLNQAVKRNSERFPDEFVFQLTKEESQQLSRSQFVTLNRQTAAGRGAHSKYLPYAFTEHGALMAANLLKSERAAKISVYVIRAFVKLRQLLSTHRELAAKLTQLEAKLQDHDGQIIALITAIRSLMSDPSHKSRPPIGYQTESKRRKRLDAKGNRS